MFVRWAVYYDDGTVWTSAESLAVDLPRDGVLARMLYFQKGREIQTGASRYFFAPSPGGTIYGNNNDTTAEILQRYPGSIVLRGKWASTSTFNRIREQAMSDRLF